MGVMRFDLICKQMEQLFVQIAGIMADLEVIVFIWLKTGYQLSILKYFNFTAFAVMMQVFTNFEMVNLFIYTDSDRVIFHSEEITICREK